VSYSLSTPPTQGTIFLFHFIGLFETGSEYVAQIGLELVIFLPLPPKWLDYKYVPPRLAKNVILIGSQIL
jgi:hypothetical protein